MKRWLTKSALVLCVALLLGCSNMVDHSQITQPTTYAPSTEVALKPASPPHPDTNLGAGAVLDYADGEKILFHTYFGIFLYSIPQQKNVLAIDPGPFGYQVQGSNPVQVFMDGDLRHIIVVEADGHGYRIAIESQLAEKLRPAQVSHALGRAKTSVQDRPGEIEWEKAASVENLYYTHKGKKYYLFK